MAKLSKQWGTIIGCWAVALVMVITGVCLALTLPSSAAEEAQCVVIFGDETTPYNDIEEAMNTVKELPTTADNPVTIKLLRDITKQGVWQSIKNNVILDLNGCVWSNYMLCLYVEDSLQIIDSRPDTLHYCGLGGQNDYKFATEKLIGLTDEIHGGVLNCGVMSGIFCRSENSEKEVNSQMIIDGGTFLGTGCIIVSDGELTINGGNLQLYVDGDSETAKDLNLSNMSGNVAVVNADKVQINGGTIYGQIFDAEVDEDDNITSANEVDLSNPEGTRVKVDSNIKMVETTDENGVKVYQAVEATTGKPVTTPNEPIAETEQPAGNNDSMIGLIILGAAAAVVVVGVTVVIMVTVKRRKKAA